MCVTSLYVSTQAVSYVLRHMQLSLQDMYTFSAPVDYDNGLGMYISLCCTNVFITNDTEH